MMDIKISKDGYISRWLIERTSSMLAETASKTKHRDKNSDRGKRKKTQNEVKPAKNTYKNIQSF